MQDTLRKSDMFGGATYKETMLGTFAELMTQVDLQIHGEPVLKRINKSILPVRCVRLKQILKDSGMRFHWKCRQRPEQTGIGFRQKIHSI
jgi:hypothetical protein